MTSNIKVPDSEIIWLLLRITEWPTVFDASPVEIIVGWIATEELAMRWCSQQDKKHPMTRENRGLDHADSTYVLHRYRPVRRLDFE